MTTNPPTHRQQKQRDHVVEESKPPHITCEKCQQILPRNLFPKEKFNKNQTNTIICRQCKKNQTAERLKQPTKAQVKQGRKSDSGIIRRPNNFGYCNYLDQLFSLDCFPDIVALKAFTSAKDVSESMGAIQAACQHGLLKDKKNAKKNIKCLCIGDGSTPRTAVLACFLKKWDCISIDPALHEVWQGVQPKGVRGLNCFGGTLEDFLIQSNNNEDGDDGTSTEKYDHLILLCVHSHARLVGNASVPNIMAKYNNIPTTLISVPCCPKFRSQKDVGRAPDIQYEDDCVFSACRRVEVWNFDYTQCIVLTEG
ncbi:hypothetical protein ACHAXR_011214 [Thalassiosira sp. AJA248-18]